MTGRSQGIGGQCKLALDISRGEILLRTSLISVMHEFFFCIMPSYLSDFLHLQINKKDHKKTCFEFIKTRF